MCWLPETITSEEKHTIHNLAIYTLEANFKKHEEGAEEAAVQIKKMILLYINSDRNSP